MDIFVDRFGRPCVSMRHDAKRIKVIPAPTVGFIGDNHSGGIVVNGEDVCLNGIPTDKAIEIAHALQAALGVPVR
jgi:hypothetical protein